MKIDSLIIKILLILVSFDTPLYGQDSINYSKQHFTTSFFFIDSIKAPKKIRNIKRLKTLVLDDYDQTIEPSRFINFGHSKFDSIVEFRLIDFKGDLVFSFSTFNSGTNFTGCAFERRANFTATEFNNNSNLHQEDRNSNTSHISLSFLSTYFKSYAQFQGINSDMPVYFGSCLFDSDAQFSHANFSNILSFNGSHFSKNLYFDNLTLAEGADFSDVILPDTLDFYNLKTVKEVELTTATLDSNKQVCYINLARSDINKIRLNYNFFKLYFNLGEKESEISSVYQKLLKKFKDEGYEDSYQKLDIEFQKYNYKKSGQWFRAWIQEWWWNFGYNKEYIFKNSFILLLLFFLINVFIGIICGYNFLIKEVYEVENIEAEVIRLQTKYTHSKVKLFFSWLPLIFIYTCMLFFILNLNIKHLRYRYKYALVYVLGVFMIGLICAAYIINFVLDK